MAEGAAQGIGLCVIFTLLALSHALYARHHGRRDTRLRIPERGWDPLDPAQQRQLREGPASATGDGGQASLLDLAERGLGSAAHFRDSVRIVEGWSRQDLSVLCSGDAELDSPFEAPCLSARHVRAVTRGHLRVGVLASAGDVDVVADPIECGGIAAEGRIELRAPRVSVRRIRGPEIRINPEALDLAALERLRREAPGAEPETTTRRVEHSLRIPRASQLSRSVTCYSDVLIEEGCRILGSLKVYGRLRVGDGVTFLGPVAVNGDIELGRDCAFASDLVAKRSISARGPLALGLPEAAPVAVTAGSIAVRGALFARGHVTTHRDAGLLVQGAAEPA